MSYTFVVLAVASLLVSEILCRPKGERRYHEITESLEFDPPSPHSRGIGLKGIRYTMKCCFRKHRHHGHHNETEDAQFENGSQDGAENEQSSNIDVEQTSANSNGEPFRGDETVSDRSKHFIGTSDLDETKLISTGQTSDSRDQNQLSNSAHQSALSQNQELRESSEVHPSSAESQPKHVSGLSIQEEDETKNDQSSVSLSQAQHASSEKNPSSADSYVSIQDEVSSSDETKNGPSSLNQEHNASELHQDSKIDSPDSSHQEEPSTSDETKTNSSSSSHNQEQHTSSSSEHHKEHSSTSDDVSQQLSINSHISASANVELENEMASTTTEATE